MRQNGSDRCTKTPVSIYGNKVEQGLRSMLQGLHKSQLPTQITQCRKHPHGVVQDDSTARCQHSLASLITPRIIQTKRCACLTSTQKLTKHYSRLKGARKVPKLGKLLDNHKMERYEAEIWREEWKKDSCSAEKLKTNTKQECNNTSRILQVFRGNQNTTEHKTT